MTASQAASTDPVRVPRRRRSRGWPAFAEGFQVGAGRCSGVLGDHAAVGVDLDGRELPNPPNAVNSSPSGSTASSYVAPVRSMTWRAAAGVSSTSTPSNAMRSPTSACSGSNASRISATHGGHHDAQKFTTTDRPHQSSSAPAAHRNARRRPAACGLARRKVCQRRRPARHRPPRSARQLTAP